MERKPTRFFQPGDRVKHALGKARRAAESDSTRRPAIGKQLRRDAGNYLWRETGYNLLLAVGLGSVLNFSVSLNEPSQYPYLSEAVASFFVLGALARESVALVNTGRLLAASLQYRRNARPSYEMTLVPVIE
jgi:hypothetical protein